MPYEETRPRHPRVLMLFIPADDNLKQLKNYSGVSRERKCRVCYGQLGGMWHCVWKCIGDFGVPELVTGMGNGEWGLLYSTVN